MSIAVAYPAKVVQYDALRHRLWIGGQRCHHGATGLLVTLIACLGLATELPEAAGHGRRTPSVIAPFAGGALLPAAFIGAHRFDRPFILWASVWAQPRSVAHAVALPMTRHIYRDADAVVAYGEHVRRFVARLRGRDDDVIVAPQ